MRERFTLQHRGKRYTVERGQASRAAAEGGGAPVDAAQWYVTLGGTAVTALPAEPEETGSALRARIRRWLDSHPELEDRGQIHLAGG
jgi:hypothetical protein